MVGIFLVVPFFIEVHLFIGDVHGMADIKLVRRITAAHGEAYAIGIIRVFSERFDHIIEALFVQVADYYHELIAACTVYLHIAAFHTQHLGGIAYQRIACVMTLVVVGIFKTVYVGEYYSHGSVPVLTVYDTVYPCIHGISVFYTCEQINRTHYFQLIHQLVIRDLGCQEKC